MKSTIEEHIKESIRAKNELLNNFIPQIDSAGKIVVDALKNNRKIIFFGNGGSASDSQHLAAEFVGRFETERNALPAIALTTDTSILTALANDYSFDIVFERQIEALGQPGDVAIGISTSGKSLNVNKALLKAKSKEIKTIGFTGKDGGELAQIADLPIIVPSQQTAAIQECHIMIGQILCRIVDQSFSPVS